VYAVELSGRIGTSTLGLDSAWRRPLVVASSVYTALVEGMNGPRRFPFTIFVCSTTWAYSVTSSWRLNTIIIRLDPDFGLPCHEKGPTIPTSSS
jgi:hypothetical protein